jgi:hypothetical protein
VGSGGCDKEEDYGGEDSLSSEMGDGGETGETVLVVVVEEEGGNMSSPKYLR